jgi:hypothetical protein
MVFVRAKARTLDPQLEIKCVCLGYTTSVFDSLLREMTSSLRMSNERVSMTRKRQEYSPPGSFLQDAMVIPAQATH